MIATKEYLERRFDELNSLCFDGRLPRVPIELSRARTYLGQCVFKRRRGLLGRLEPYNFRLRVSVRYDLPEEELADTLLHEMIHLYIGVNRLRDTSAHGRLFRQLMDDINQRHGRHVTVSHHSTPEQRAAVTDQRPRWHMVALVDFTDGRTGVKVLPVEASRVVRYYNVVSAQPRVAAVALYLCRDAYFNRFPCSSAFNVVYADGAELRSHLAAAERLGCDGQNITRNQNDKT